MSKVAIVILADTETHESLGRVVNALEAVKEFKDAHDDIQLIIDGVGPKWIPELEKPDHKLHELYTAVKDRISGACEYRAGAFGVKDQVVACGVKLAGDYDGHSSFKNSSRRGIKSLRSELMGRRAPYLGTESRGQDVSPDSLSCENSVEYATYLYRFDDNKTGLSSL